MQEMKLEKFIKISKKLINEDIVKRLMKKRKNKILKFIVYNQLDYTCIHKINVI